MLRAECLLLISQIFMEEAVAKGGSKDASKKVTEMVQLISPQFNKKGAGSEAAPGSEVTRSASGAARQLWMRSKPNMREELPMVRAAGEQARTHTPPSGFRVLVD